MSPGSYEIDWQAIDVPIMATKLPPRTYKNDKHSIAAIGFSNL